VEQKMNSTDDSNPYLLWMRNVKDEYKSLPTEEIRSILQKKALPFAVCMSQIKSDFNFGTLVRNANNFGAREVYYYGQHRRWNKRGALGTYCYTDVKYLPTVEELAPLKDQYLFIGIENNINLKTTMLKDFVWPDKPVLILFGEETLGLPDEVVKMLDYCVEIPSMGSTRSINVGSASAVVMYDYISKLGR
jgi:tRNA G18 (ribose-2'-O)-methylase SpoU